jgi:hypothetical protein
VIVGGGADAIPEAAGDAGLESASGYALEAGVRWRVFEGETRDFPGSVSAIFLCFELVVGIDVPDFVCGVDGANGRRRRGRVSFERRGGATKDGLGDSVVRSFAGFNMACGDTGGRRGIGQVIEEIA